MIYTILVILLIISIGFNVYSMKRSKLFFRSYTKDLEKLHKLTESKKDLVVKLLRLRRDKQSLKEKLDELEKLTPQELTNRGMDISNKLRGRLKDSGGGDSTP